MLSQTYSKSSLLKSQVDRLAFRLTQLETQTGEMRLQLAAIQQNLIPKPAPPLVPELPNPERVLRSGSVVMKKTGKPLLKKQLKPLPRAKPSPVSNKPCGRPRNSTNGQHDAHVRRFKRLAYMREYMRARKTRQVLKPIETNGN
jgi:hypothetical protein